MAYCFDDEPMEFWELVEPFPQVVADYIASGGPIMAHNASFEADIFDFVIAEDYDITPPKREQWQCSMVIALANGHPAGLGELAKSLCLPLQKQEHGTRLIREYCAVNFKDIFLPQFEADRELMKEYCVFDVEVMREAVKRMRDLTPTEWAEYHLTEKINDKGLPVDLNLCRSALMYSNELNEDASKEISRITDGKMTKHTQRKARDAFVLPRLEQHHLDLISVYKKGEKKLSFDQEHRKYLLDCDDLDHEVRELLEYIDAAGSSALKKYAVAVHCEVDGHVHHTFQFHGAQTGRFSGRGLQPHNMRRDAYPNDEAEALISDIIAGYEIEQPGRTMARLLRSMITHPDGVYFVDWSNIEGRIAPWISADSRAQARIDLFAAGADLYKRSAMSMFGIPTEDLVDDNQRQSGKVAELSLGYGGAKGALTRMAKNYGMVIPEHEAENIVTLWRSANQWAVDIWHEFERAAEDAVNSPGVPFKAGRCTYQRDDDYLWCMLPSGRVLAYAFPDVEYIDDPWGGRYKATFQTPVKPAKDAVGRVRAHLRGALIFQNAVQACAADILRGALLGCDEAGLDIRLHCHDEIMGVGPEDDGERLNTIMLTTPNWADGLPLATGGVKWAKRYGK